MKNFDLKSVIANVKEAYDIENYISQDGIVLKNFGRNKYRGLCPFHNEKTPSFTVDVQFQNYYCFGCKANGDIFTYVSQSENLSFFEALKMLAENKGIELDLDETNDTVDYKSLKELSRATAKFFVKQFRSLDKDHPAWTEILNRGLSPKTLTFGYSPEKRTALYKHLKDQGYSDDLIEQSGVCRKSDNGSFYDFWSGRLMFIISDIQGNPIGFSGRKLYDSDKRGKYVNSSDGPLFNKSTALFNLSRAKKEAGSENTIFVVEGQFDVAAFNHSGLNNVVASSGTAFTESQGKICQRLVGPSGKIVFCFDGDSAGVQAAVRAFETLPELHSSAYAVIFPEDKDPCDYMLDNGKDELNSFVKSNQISLIDFVLKSLEKESDLESAIGRTQYVKKASDLLSHIKNKTLLENAIREVSLNSLASYETIVSSVKKSREKLQSSRTVTKTDEKDLSRPDLKDDSADYEELLELIENDRFYHMAAKYISLGARFSKLRKAIIEKDIIIPKEMRPLAQELETMNKEIIPEKFENLELAETIFAPDFLPYLNSFSDKEIVEQFTYLRKSLSREKDKRWKDNLTSKITRILDEGESNGIEALEKALKIEKRELEKMSGRE